LKKRSANRPYLEVAAALVWDGDRILITRRPPGTYMEGYWEFPGGKREPGETLEQCVKRELREELGLEVEVLEYLSRVSHEYEDRVIELHVFRCRILKGDAEAKESQEICWADAEDLDTYLFAPPDKEIVKKIVLKSLIKKK